jgi:hypothetical protein
MKQPKPLTSKRPYYCSECLEPCQRDVVDYGIGRYEYWGAMFSDHNYQEVSDCCEGDLLDEYPEEEEQE